MYIVNKDLCVGCKRCLNECPANEFIVVEDNKVETKNKNCISCAHCIAVCPQKAISCSDKLMDELIEYNEDTFSINPDNLLNFMKFRRSKRHFNEKRVNESDLLKVIEAGRYCPSATNSEDVSYVVVEDKLEEFKDLVMLALKEKGDLILSMNEDEITPTQKFYGKVFTVMYKRYVKDKTVDKLFFNAKTILLVKSKNPVNALLSSSYMELMINALGLSTCYIGFAIEAIKDNVALAKFLDIKNDEVVSTCFAIGYDNTSYLRTTLKKEASITKL